MALFVVATPIGNREDLSERARHTLKKAAVIACEDTRRTGALLSHLNITAPRLLSYHDHNEQQRLAELLAILRAGGDVILVSDAGTPGINDPGAVLVDAAHREGVPVIPIPGASAPVALLSVAGLAIDRWTYLGFFPRKDGDRIREIRSWTHAVVFLESPARIAATLTALAHERPQNLIIIGREMTKQFEEVARMKAEAGPHWLSANPHREKGEFTVVVQVAAPSPSELESLAKEQITLLAVEAFAAGATVKELLQRWQNCGLDRKELYRVLLRAKK